jgi:hypothetical protein
MRKITEKARQAWIGGYDFKSGNTEVRVTFSGDSVLSSGDIKELLLHGNCIAWRDTDGVMYFSLCGWNTPTTRERLQAVGVIVSTKQGQARRHHDNGTIENINSDTSYRI